MNAQITEGWASK